jgi:hypothetical protein
VHIIIKGTRGRRTKFERKIKDALLAEERSEERKI